MLLILLCFIFILRAFNRNASFFQPLGFQWVMSPELQRLVLSVKDNYLTGDGDYNVLIRIQCLRHCTAFCSLYHFFGVGTFVSIFMRWEAEMSKNCNSWGVHVSCMGMAVQGLDRLSSIAGPGGFLYSL